jgi:4-diphosphocytidyl-2-C-methyl-D-erythritol kinase
MAPLTLRARAKLNLFLHIQGRRADGYHRIESFIAFASLADELTLAPSENVTLSVMGEFAGDAGGGEGNLVLRAAESLRQHTGCTAGVHITLAKHIPVGAGLGGGSADAAATLHGLNDFWQLGLSMPELHALAVPLGADVAMCLAGSPAIARGIGDELAPLAAPLPPLYAVLAHPRIPLLTADVYRAYQPSTATAPWQASWDGAKGLLGALRSARNDLQAAAIITDARVAELLLELESLLPEPALVRMSGSGACCYALYDESASAERAASALIQQRPDWWVRACAIES